MTRAIEIVNQIGKRFNNNDDVRGEVGYFENKGAYSDDMIRKSISYFRNMFPRVQDFVLVTSFHIDVNLDEFQKFYEISDEEMRDVILPFYERGWIKKIDYTIYGDDYDAPEYEAEMDYLTYGDHLSFALSEADACDVEKLCRMSMSISGVHGHCHFVECELGLVIHPIQNTGFAAFTTGAPEARELALAFLRSVDDSGLTIFITAPDATDVTQP